MDEVVVMLCCSPPPPSLARATLLSAQRQVLFPSDFGTLVLLSQASGGGGEGVGRSSPFGTLNRGLSPALCSTEGGSHRAPRTEVLPERTGLWVPGSCPSRTAPPRPPHGRGVCIGMPLVNGTGNSPVSGTADPRSSQTGQVIRGLR